MTDLRIATPRGAQLATTVLRPDEASDKAVVFSHDFMSDRHQGFLFDALAKAYRQIGFATIQFDFSGSGASSHDILTKANQIEDLQAVCSWAAQHGFTRQLIHGAGYGGTVALDAFPPQALAMTLTDPTTGPVSYPWEEIFSEEQLSALERTGTMKIPDDSPSPRKEFQLSKQTLADLSLVDQQQIMSKTKVPVLILIGGDQRLVELSRGGFPLLANGSRLEVVSTELGRITQANTELTELVTDWAQLRIR